MSSNILVVMSGPSGSGKSTMVRMLLEKRDDFKYSVSATTRSPRRGETDKKDYFFVSEQKFKDMIKNKELLEWAYVYGKYYYGTPSRYINETLETSNVVIDVDVQGGIQIMENFPDALFIFIETENLEELEKRITRRGGTNPDELKARLETARKELEFKNRYNHIVMNKDLDKAFSELLRIIEDREKRDGQQ